MAPNGSDFHERLLRLEEKVAYHDRWQEIIERVASQLVSLREAINGSGDQAGLAEKVDAILRFLGGTVVVRPQRREVVVEQAPFTC